MKKQTIFNDPTSASFIDPITKYFGIILIVLLAAELVALILQNDWL